VSVSRDSARIPRANAFEGPPEDYVAPPLYVWLIVLLLVAGSGSIVVGLILLKQISLTLLAGLPADLTHLRG
jgi:hypothetical protein